MTREQIVDICNKEISKTITIEDIVTVLQNYCKEKAEETGKVWSSIESNVDQCINTLVSVGQWRDYFEIAINYYKSKFNIVECYSVEEEIPTPLGVTKSRRLLQVL